MVASTIDGNTLFERRGMFIDSNTGATQTSGIRYTKTGIRVLGTTVPNYVISSNIRDITIEAGRDLYLRAPANGTNGIYVRGYNLSTNTLLRNPNGTGGASGATEVSSAVVKKNIEDLDTEVLQDFFDTIDIKSFTYKEDDSAGISLIIEDEQADGIPYQDALFAKIQGQLLYES
jgi:hypothetical protein